MMETERNVNPYAPPSEAGVKPAFIEVSPIVGPILVATITILFTCFLGYLLLFSPPDRWPATVMSTMLPGLFGYAWILRRFPRHNLRMLGIVGGLFSIVYLYFSLLPGTNVRALTLLFMVVAAPVVLAGLGTWFTSHRYPIAYSHGQTVNG